MAQESSPEHSWRVLVCAHCGHEIKVLVDCKNRFCSQCAPRRSARISNRLNWLVNHIKPLPGYRLKMITLSTSNCSDIRSGVSHLLKSFRKLRQRTFWREKVEGGGFVIEITGRPGNWHPHIHAVLYSSYMPWRRLWKDWKQVSGGNAVYITSCSPDAAMRYITKYISKSIVPPHLQVQLSMELSRYRLFQRFGSWHGLKLPSRVWDYRCESCGRCDWLADVYQEHIQRRYKTWLGAFP